jgi:hypothetical protein
LFFEALRGSFLAAHRERLRDRRELLDRNVIASVSPFPHAQLFVEAIDGEMMAIYITWLAMTYAPTMALACAAALPCGRDHMADNTERALKMSVLDVSVERTKLAARFLAFFEEVDVLICPAAQCRSGFK